MEGVAGVGLQNTNASQEQRRRTSIRGAVAVARGSVVAIPFLILKMLLRGEGRRHAGSHRPTPYNNLPSYGSFLYETCRCLVWPRLTRVLCLIRASIYTAVYEVRVKSSRRHQVATAPGLPHSEGRRDTPEWAAEDVHVREELYLLVAHDTFCYDVGARSWLATGATTKQFISGTK